MTSDYRICIADGCEKEIVARGLCPMHWKRWRKSGGKSLEPKRIAKYPPGAKCRHLDGCERPVKARGWCKMHWDRIRSKGDPGPSGRVYKGWSRKSKTNGRTTNALGYVILWQPDRKKYLFEHRVVMERIIGRPLTDGETVHHKNGIRDDNSPENLELWVTPPRKGQRAGDLVDWVVQRYPELAIAALEKRSRDGQQVRFTL